MDDIHIEKLLNRRSLKRLDDQAREELRVALRQEASMRIFDDGNFDMDSFDKSHRESFERLVVPIFERFRERQKERHGKKYVSSLYKDAKHKVYIFLAVILFIIAVTLLGIL